MPTELIGQWLSAGINLFRDFGVHKCPTVSIATFRNCSKVVSNLRVLGDPHERNQRYRPVQRSRHVGLWRPTGRIGSRAVCCGRWYNDWPDSCWHPWRRAKRRWKKSYRLLRPFCLHLHWCRPVRRLSTSATRRLLRSNRLLAPSSAACQFHVAAIPKCKFPPDLDLILSWRNTNIFQRLCLPILEEDGKWMKLQAKCP